jgi:hypothetical protein
MDIVSKGFLGLISAFNDNHVKYLLVGGWAVNHYGYSRTTADIDFWLKDNSQNRTNLIEAFNQLEYGNFLELERIPFLPGFCEIYLDFGMYADLLSEIHGFNQTDFDLVYENSNTQVINNIPINFISYNDLLFSKSQSNRAKDMSDFNELQRINNL